MPPGRQGPGEAGARQSDGQADLAAGRPGQEFAERDEICVGPRVEPAPARHELRIKIAKVRHRPAERGLGQA